MAGVMIGSVPGLGLMVLFRLQAESPFASIAIAVILLLVIGSGVWVSRFGRSSHALGGEGALDRPPARHAWAATVATDAVLTTVGALSSTAVVVLAYVGPAATLLLMVVVVDRHEE